MLDAVCLEIRLLVSRNAYLEEVERLCYCTNRRSQDMR